MTLLDGKRGLIVGVANDRSIAWGIAETLSKAGAELAFTYQGDSVARRVKPLAESLGSKIVLPCDAEDSASVDAVFKALAETWGKLDFLVHSIAFSDKNELKGRYVDTSADNFARTMRISCFSFTDMARRARPLMTDGGSLITLSYYGAERVMPSYNVMGVAKAGLEAATRYAARDLGQKGIRVNAISAGPMRTLAMAGIKGGKTLMSTGRDWSLLKEDTSMEGVAGCALYLLSPLGRSITGEVVHVDAGFHIVGVPDLQDGGGSGA